MTAIGSRPTAIDPPGCGCTECLTGEHVDLDHATAAQIRAMIASEIADNTGGTWTVTSEARFHYEDGAVCRSWDLPAQSGPVPAYDRTALEVLLRRVARPGGTSRELLQMDAAAALVRLGATCTPRHIGPLFTVPGSDQAERCLTCGAVSGK